MTALAASPRTTTTARPPQTRIPRRPDLQGLRALAVLLVVADHLLGWPRGGFLGVDVFFVLSGFLITGLIVAELQRTGRFSLRGFYARRVRRILPAAALVLIVTTALAQVLLIGSRARQTTVDAVWSTFFAANWHFARTGTDYFASELPPSPLQHYWSLAVEEQFYLVWPWLLVLVLVVLAGRWSARHRLVALSLVVGLAVVASFAWGYLDTAQHPTAAYFSTFSRAWQLGLGSLLAVLPISAARWRPQLRIALALAGVGAIVAAALLVGPDSAVPVPGAGLAVLGAGAVIVAGQGVPGYAGPVLLTNPVSRYVGDISFSLYLWHWPVIVLLAAVHPLVGWPVLLFAAVLTGVLSVASYHLVEVPVRDRGRPAAAPTRRRRRRKRRQLNRRTATLVTVLACATALVASGSLLTLSGADGDTAAPSPTDPTAGTGGATAVSLVVQPPGSTGEQVQNELQQALASATWPTLVPGPDDTDALPAGHRDPTACIDAAPKGCRVGDGSAGTLLVVGDSIASRYRVTAARALEPRGWKVVDGSRPGCEMLDTRFTPISTETRQSADRCDATREVVLTQLQNVRPDVVLLANDYTAIDHLESGLTGAAANAEWSAALRRTVQQLDRYAGRVVVATAPPRGGDLRTCLTKFSRPRDCVQPVPASWGDLRDAERQAASRERATFLDTSGWFCTDRNLCPAFSDGMLIRFDALHLTTAYAERVADLMTDALVAAKIVRR